MSRVQSPVALSTPPPDLKIVGEMPRLFFDGTGSRATTAAATAAIGTDAMISTPTQANDGLNKLFHSSLENHNTATTSVTIVNAQQEPQPLIVKKPQKYILDMAARKHSVNQKSDEFEL